MSSNRMRPGLHCDPGLLFFRPRHLGVYLQEWCPIVWEVTVPEGTHIRRGMVNSAERVILSNPRHFRNCPEQWIVWAVTSTPDLIALVDNPTVPVQVAAVTEHPPAIKRIAAPDQFVQMIAVRAMPDAIMWIDQPSESTQLVAVERDWRAIRHIQAPTPLVQLTAVQQNTFAYEWIREPTRAARAVASRHWRWFWRLCGR